MDTAPGMLNTLDEKFLWNRHLLRPAFRDLPTRSPFMLPLIHGFVDQAS